MDGIGARRYGEYIPAGRWCLLYVDKITVYKFNIMSYFEYYIPGTRYIHNKKVESVMKTPS